MAKFLVTGGCGFIGSNIAEYLVREGHEVRILDNLSTGRRENIAGFIHQVELIEGDLLDPKVVEQAVSGVEYVLHQAALPSVQRSVEDPERSDRVNVGGTVTLLNACRKAGVRRVVYAASSSAYGDQPVPVKHEGLLPMPKSPYAVSKLAGEYYMQAFATCYGLETVCLRYFNVFGPRQDPTSEYSAVIPKFITRILRGEQPVIYGDGTQTRDFTYVENNVRANLAAAFAPNVSGRVFNVACGTSFSLLDLVREINSILGTKVEPIFAPPRKGDVRHSLADITAAKEAFGYEVTVDFREGLRRTIAWYREQLGL
ncbi:MAG: SDR family oxidoreductase [Candidatus Hydrogenedentota bacterium]|uniref:UDP-glucose 4-epimerase n=1 Tax=Sumerlaea chitinivorans TaxID=2250252 RepID=A0A2Z4Y338_SUMC1|nr:UDP-glucose 4-epimerase [Candidatus Sumerlaea chitinivorans]RMH31224.1 MAG: SDR family oxidoreductase [Candidatus Hydrogenedentota bacterium]GIX45396.1 MAG: UDP-glucose 4-epimerase-like protein [Candidatus Sumerlaea sp.]